MNNKETIIKNLKEQLIKLEEKWNNGELDLSLPKQILLIKEEINNLLTEK